MEVPISVGEPVRPWYSLRPEFKLLILVVLMLGAYTYGRVASNDPPRDAIENWWTAQAVALGEEREQDGLTFGEFAKLRATRLCEGIDSSKLYFEYAPGISHVNGVQRSSTWVQMWYARRVGSSSYPLPVDRLGGDQLFLTIAVVDQFTGKVQPPPRDEAPPGHKAGTPSVPDWYPDFVAGRTP